MQIRNFFLNHFALLLTIAYCKIPYKH